jgi:hypothetical protein
MKRTRSSRAGEFDEPPITPVEKKSTSRPLIVLTGGPGGGKSSLIEDLRRDPDWASRFVALPEVIQYAGSINISPREKLFQRAMVHLQIGLEEGLDHALGPADPRPIICHRGSLDPIAFWRQRGWVEEEFFTFVGLSRVEHYHRYTAVIHLVTSADGAPRAYTRWPQAHRPEEADDAIRLDRWLQQAWSDHPKYFCIDNKDRDWPSKASQARTILTDVLRWG